ncbi:MAG TPA: hypothetical protein VIK27_13180 [Candidatus Aquilonibacter sp.]
MTTREPSRGRLLFLVVVGAIVAVVETVVLVLYGVSGTLTKDALGHVVLPVFLLGYGLYVFVTSLRKLRVLGR